MMSAEQDLKANFIKGMGLAASTVNVVTTQGRAGRAGVTVSAMTSVSADGDAPTLLVCIHHLSPVAQIMIDNGCFCTNILKHNQIHISDTFAGRTQIDGDEKFSCANWSTMPSGALRVVDPLVAFDCTIKSHQRVGTHHVFIGEVGDIFTASYGNPLIYANRSYGSPVPINQPTHTRHEKAHYRLGSFHTFGPYLLPALLRKMQDEMGLVNLELYEGDQYYLLELLRSGVIDFAFLYDFGLDDSLTKYKISDTIPYVLLAANDELAQCDELSIKDLLDKQLVLLDIPPSGDYFMSLFDGVGVPTVSYRTKSFEMVRGMVAHGLGYSLLVTKPASSMSYDGRALTTRPLVGELILSPLVLCSQADVHEDVDVGQFLNFFKAQFFTQQIT